MFKSRSYHARFIWIKVEHIFTFACEPYDQDSTPLEIGKTKDAKLIGIINDIEFDYDDDGTPLGFHTREQCKVGLHMDFG